MHVMQAWPRLDSVCCMQIVGLPQHNVGSSRAPTTFVYLKRWGFSKQKSVRLNARLRAISCVLGERLGYATGIESRLWETVLSRRTSQKPNFSGLPVQVGIQPIVPTFCSLSMIGHAACDKLSVHGLFP